jgi:chitin disaccharide deacetylase
MSERQLIVNADDFGLSAGVNRGIVQAHDHGIVTSTSLMVRGPAAEEAVALVRARPGMSLGIHIDLGEWVYRDDEWQLLYEVVATDDPAAVAQEIDRQLATFRSLTGQNPTHLDSHQHVHRDEPVRSILAERAHRLGVPLRSQTPRVGYCGAFYGQTGKGEPMPGAITVESLLAVLAELPPGVTELACHPGYADDLDSPYRTERAQEVVVLCDPRVRAALSSLDIRLSSFRELTEGRVASG